MKTLPSIELLSEVLGEDVLEISDRTDSVRVTNSQWHKVNRETEFVYRTEENMKIINIYELAHMVKEWARKSNIRIVSGVYSKYGNYKALVEPEEHDWNLFKCSFSEETEHEAIFKAGEHILKGDK